MRAEAGETRVGNPIRVVAALLAAVAATLAMAAPAFGALGSLTLVESDNPTNDVYRNVAVSPDGTSVYATAANEDAVALFSRVPSTGSLTFVEFKGEADVPGIAQFDGPVDVTVSPDGAYVYATAAASHTLVTFARNPGTGALTYHDLEAGATSGGDQVAVSPDGSTVYTTGVRAYQRNLDGTLTLIDTVTDGVSGADGLASPTDVVVSPDGENVYVTAGIGDYAVTTLDRAPDGTIAFNETIKDDAYFGPLQFLAAPGGLDISDDGANVYVTSTDDDALNVFTRDPSDGDLTLLEVERDGLGSPTADGLNDVGSIDVAPEGRSVYVTSTVLDDSVATFDRNPSTGALSYVELDSRSFPSGVAVSPDSRHVYVASEASYAVSTFSRELLAPSNTGSPSVSGNAVVGSTLSCSLGTWNGVPAPTLTREWLRNGTPIALQTGSTYTTVQADVGANVACKVTATNSAGSANDTSNAIAVSEPPPAPPTPPTFKQTVNAEPVSGSVTYQCPGGPVKVLDQAILLPIGCTVDASGGRMSLTSADQTGATQQADFYGDAFRMAQVVDKKKGKTKKKGKGRKSAAPVSQRTYTQLTLTTSPTGCKGAKSSGAVAQKSRGGGLWGRGSGRFRTSGRRSSATVRGTTWFVQDTCAGTLTRVAEGTVIVDDFTKDKTVTLRPGQSYLAKPPKKK